MNLFQFPEQQVPQFLPTAADERLRHLLSSAIQTRVCDAAAIDRAFAGSSFPQAFARLIVILYAPGQKRILVSRSTSTRQVKVSDVVARVLAHPRCAELAALAFRLQLDFVVEPPKPMDLYGVGTTMAGPHHFEIGIDGLLFRGSDEALHLFPPGDGYVRSVMSMGQLRDYLTRIHGEAYLRAAEFKRFRSLSLVSSPDGWLSLYRGHPVVGALSREKLEHAVNLAIDHIQRTQEPDGKFLYYYDSALDSRRDHEHPKRDPAKNPYYNILRHGGGGLTCVFYEKLVRTGQTLGNMRRAIDYLVSQARLQTYGEREGAYIYSEKKSKLGGAGIALYLLAQYQLVTGDDRYRLWADRLAWHLLHQITSSGEFIYYNIYLDRPITETENHQYFSFYYPGEAVCGLAKYLHLLNKEEREPYLRPLHKALQYLIQVRPVARASEYTSVPSDGWLMMGIMELWDFEEMRQPLYADFVFSDAQKMIDQMYKVTDAPYPDYAGAFYYQFGDFPYADGARCEGLMGAYELAVKMGDKAKAAGFWQAIRLAAWAVMHLVNTEDSIYFAPNPHRALGGIRFKHTRQWFRIDTIQHVASFYAKMLPYWDEAERGAHSP